MPAKSKAQQRLMGLVKAVQKGDVPKSKVSKAVKKMADKMKEKDVDKYASIKHKNLPNTVQNETQLNELTTQQVISIQVTTAVDRCDKIIKDLIKNEVGKRDKKKALELMKLYKKYWVEFSARAKSANPLKESTVVTENPAAIAAAQRMVVQNKAGKKISVNTARQSKYAETDPSAHKKAKSIFQRIKDKFMKKEQLKEVELFFEKNVPTDKSKWSYYKSQAKKKFDVYPSAYANAWAAKMYKKAGGGWRKTKG